MYFVPTKAYDKVANEIKSHNLVIVSGHSESGKSAIIQHIALTYRREGWNVKPLSCVQELINTCLQGKRLKKTTLMILNDPFGKESFDERLYDLWSINEDALETCLKTNKLLMSCRKNVLPENRIKRNEVFRTSSIVKIESDKYELTEEEKRNILHIYACDSNLSEEEIKEICQIKALPYFPSLCKSYARYGINLTEGIAFFKEPIEVFVNELIYYRHYDKEKYCALVLLVFFNNHLRINDLIEENNKTKYQHALDLCGIQYIAPYIFGDILNSLDNFIVKRNDGIFQFHHDFLMDVTTLVFGTDYPKTAIKYGNVSFLRRKVRLNNSTNDNNQFIIILSEKCDMQELGKRLFTEIFTENLLDVVLNPCLRNKEVCQALINEIEHDFEKLYKLLERRKINIDEQRYDWTMKNSFMTDVSFVVLEHEISPLFALIAFCHTELSEWCLKTLIEKQPCCMSNYLFFAVCSNGSKTLLNMFSKDNTREYLKEKFGNLYPIHIVSIFHRYEVLSELVQLNIDVNAETDDDNGWTPLILAASNDTEENQYSQENSTETWQEQTMQILLSNGANINLCAKNGLSPLFVACKNGNNRAVKFLLKKGAAINYQCAKYRKTPLYISCHENHKDTAQLLLDHGANVDLCTQNGVSLLYNACQDGHDNFVKFLVKSGADINLCTEEGASPFYAACHNGHHKTVCLLLSNGADINLSKKNGESPIYTASNYGYLSIVELLLHNNANNNLCKKNRESPLYVACKNGHERIVQLLLEHDDLNNVENIDLCTKDRFSPLCIASLNGHIQTVQLLLNFGADINLCSKFNESPLYAASVSGNNIIVKSLLQYGADLNFCNEEGESPLYAASQCILDRFEAVFDENDLDVNTLRENRDNVCYRAYQKDYESTVLTLINNGAEINSCKKNGESPLYIASAHGFESIVQHLLQNYANVNLSRVNKESPLFAACKNGHENIVKLLLNDNISDNKTDVNLCSEDGTSPLILASLKGHVRIVELLLCHEANVNTYNEDGASPIYAACQNGHKSIVNLLLKKKADVNLSKKNGKSPLYIASAHGFDSIVELLLNKANINLCRKNGESPLYAACENGHESVVQLLLNCNISGNKADVDLCREDGTSPLCIARQRGHAEIVKHLLSHGADQNLCDKVIESPT